jgi:hypothetical protein
MTFLPACGSILLLEYDSIQLLAWIENSANFAPKPAENRHFDPFWGVLA